MVGVHEQLLLVLFSSVVVLGMQVMLDTLLYISSVKQNNIQDMSTQQPSYD